MSDKSITHPMLNLSHIREFTIEYGEGWAYPHACRVMHLITEIGADLVYDHDVITYAAYLHDWGSFPRFRIPGMEHALRSMQVAEIEILPFTMLSQPARQAVMDAIALHDYRDPRPATAIESLLLREADMLEMLGVVGTIREFAWGPNNLKICYERLLSRRAGIMGRLTLPRAQVIAESRLASMDHILAQLRDECFDLF